MGRTKFEHKIQSDFTEEGEDDEGLMRANLDLMEGETKTANLESGVVRITKVKGSKSKTTKAKAIDVAIDEALKLPIKDILPKEETKTEPPTDKRPTPPERPHYDSDGKITWTRIKPDGSWGIRVPNTYNVKEGSHVEVHRKDGTTSDQVLGVIVYKNEDVKIYFLKTNGVSA